MFVCASIFLLGNSTVFATTWPNFLHSNPGNGGIHPTGNFDYIMTYEDLNTGIDTTTDILKLYKWNGTSWGSNIAPSHINFSGKTITKNKATYPVNWLGYGKYKFVFNIDNFEGNVWIYETIFFVDRPSYTIEKDENFIGILSNITKIFSPEEIVTVKTIWAPYTLSMERDGDLQNDWEQVLSWDGTKWWGYEKEPYYSNISAVPSVLTIKEKPYTANLSWILNNDTYRFKFWAKDSKELGWDYITYADFGIDLEYCPEYNDDGSCKTYGITISNWTDGKRWSDGTYAETCYYYKHPSTSWYSYLWDIWDGYYYIQPDTAKPAFKVYCDMTTNGWGWTEYVKIKWNYSYTDAISCWQGNNINNANLECFNPNRYNIPAAQLMNKEWNGTTYYYSLIDSNPSVTTQTSSGIRKCVGHDEYMTIMRRDTYPLVDGSDTQYTRLGRNFCKYSRDPGGAAYNSNFMSYDSAWSFWESAGAGRQGNAKNTKIYFREVDLGHTQGFKEIETYASGRRWSDQTYAKSCDGYNNPGLWYSYSWDVGDGMYYIDPDGNGWDPEFLVECDMTTDGWGWTLVSDWEKTPSKYEFPTGIVQWWDELLMKYQRVHNGSNWYALRVDKMKTKQCWAEYTTAAAYVNHIQTGSWGTCARRATNWDYNDIQTSKVVEWIYLNDACVNGTWNKTTARNFSRWLSGTRGIATFRVSNTVVLMWPTGGWSTRCAGSTSAGNYQTAVKTYTR